MVTAFTFSVNPIFQSRTYHLAMTYGKRLEEALKKAGKSRTELADHIGYTRQAIGMLINFKGNRPRTLNTDAHVKAARFLGVNPDWLLYGSGQMTDPIQGSASSDEVSPTAMELARLFDMVPVSDRIGRAVAYQGATDAILRVLRSEHVVLPSSSPSLSRTPEKRSS